MRHVTLGKGGPRVSEVGLGMWQAGGALWGDDVTDRGCLAAMRRASEVGVTLIDTAEVYGDGHSEEVVGRAIKAIGRDEIVIATKVGGNHLRPDDIRKACDGSLRRLGIREIDIYQIHWPDPWEQVPLRETMKSLEALKRAGKIRHIAVSNFAVRDLEEARAALSRADVVENQIHWSLLHRDAERETVPYCVREGIGILPWSPLEKGLLTGKYRRGRTPKDRLRKDHVLFKAANLPRIEGFVRLLRRIGDEHGKTSTQVALNWLMRQRGVVVPIPGAKDAEQAEENAGAGGWRLMDDEVRRIGQASARLALDTF